MTPPPLDPDTCQTPQAQAARYTRQMALVRGKNPALAGQIEQANLAGLTLEASRAGIPTARLQVAGRTLYLHSKYDPRREATGWLPTEIPSPIPAFVLIGLGLGYHAEALTALVGPPTPLLLCEPDPAVWKLALACRDLDSLLTADNVLLLGDMTAAALQNVLLTHHALLADGASLLTAPVTQTRCSQYIETVRAAIAAVVAFAQSTRETDVRGGPQTIRNLLGNLERYTRAESVAHWRGCCRGVPAVLVAAGPSLARHRSLLASAREKALLIAVAATAKQLLALPVIPDLLVHLDHSELAARQLEGLPDVGNCLLLGDAVANPTALAAWPGRLAMPYQPLAAAILASLAPAQPELPQGLTVAHTAFSVAEFLGCDPIILVGLDLAFTDNLYYSAGNALHELWRSELNRFTTVETKQWERLARRQSQLACVPGVTGSSLLTDRQMLAYLRQFEALFSQSAARVLDATEGGVAKRGAEAITLEAALALCPTTPVPRERLQQRPGVPASSEKVTTARQRLREQVVHFAQTARQLAGVQQEILTNREELLSSEATSRPLARLFSQLEQLQRQIAQQGELPFRLATTYNAQLEVERTRVYRQTGLAGVEALSRQRERIAADRQYVLGLAQAALAMQANIG